MGHRLHSWGYLGDGKVTEGKKQQPGGESQLSAVYD
jgi:hypothetical protein